MATETSLKAILKLAIPIILTGIAEPLINATDLALIGQRVNGGIAAVGLGSSATLAIVWIASALLNPVSARIGYFLGRGELEKIKTLTHWMTVRVLVLFTLLSIGLYFICPQIIQLYSPKELSVLNMAIEFLEIRIVGLPFLLGAVLLFQVFKGMQNTKTAFYITLTAGLMNLLGDYLLIDGLWIFPQMGIAGAALASSLSHVVMFTLSFLYAYKKKLFSNIDKTLSVDLKSLFSNSINLMVRTILLNVTLFVGNKITAQQGDLYLELQTILGNMFLIIAFFLDGIAGSASAICSKLNGERNYRSIKSVGLKSVGMNLLIALVFVVIGCVVYPEVLMIYTTNIFLTSIFESVMLFYFLTILIGSIAFTFDGIFVGLERITFLRNTLIAATISFVLFLLLTQDYTLHGIWLALFIWMAIRGVIPFFGFLKEAL